MAIEGAARPDGVAWTPVPVDDIQSQSNSGAGARSAAEKSWGIEMLQHHLILGGDSFIGRNIALLLARAGHRITIATRALPAFSFPAEVASCIRRTLGVRSLRASTPIPPGFADQCYCHAWPT
jgi:hypothetical protein